MHKKFLLLALDLARHGQGLCAPNPCVGAIAVKNGEVIGKDWHKGSGTPHAEQLVLEQLSSKRLSDVTLYVTLEPCNHWGKTPPCVNAIIEKGIKRVVFAYRDPNPLVIANDTPQILNQQGVEVIHHPLPEVDEFYQSYKYWVTHKMPRITAKIAQSFDGKIAREDGTPVALSNEKCSVFTHKKRRQADIILTTARTITKDNPQLNVRFINETISKPIAILDRTLSLEGNAKIFDTAAICHVFHDESLLVQNKLDKCCYHAVPVKNGALDIVSVVQQLGRLGFHDVWVEAGGQLFSALHEVKLVNQTYLYLTPHVLGKNAIEAYPSCQELFRRPYTMKWHPVEDNMIVSLTWYDNDEERICSPE